MIRNIAFFLLSFSLFWASARAGDGYKATHPSSKARITPCARGVVYVKMNAGSEVLQSSSQSGANTLSIAPSSKLGRVIATLGLREIDPFDPAPKDSISRAFGIDRMYCIYYSNYNIDPHSALRMLMGTGEVECGSVRYLFPVSFTPNDPLISQEYALTNMNIFNAWNTTTGDTNVIIADVDIAINIDHEDLKNEVQYNWGETGLDASGHDKRSNGIDDEKDGYVDNWEGWDLCGDVNVGDGAILKPNNNPRPREATANHGTLTAGCILATGNNTVGVAGIAYGCRLLPVKAAGSDDDNIGAGYEGIHYACNHNARIINCSWGGFIPSSDTEYSNIFLYEATARNALVVAAAGNNTASNDGTYEYPADGPGVLSVGATDQTNAPADFSDFGHSVSVWAPGVNVMSTDYDTGLDANSLYGAEDGTSFSSPLTAGVAGLLMSVHPDWPPQFIARQIIQTAANVVDTADRADYWGLVDADSAMNTAPWPGLIITQYAINGVVSDSLGAAGVQQDLKVTFQDVLAAGTNISATLIPYIVYSATSTPVMLGTMDSGATASGDFQITRSGVFSQGVVPLKFFVTDGNRLADTLLVYVNLSQIPGFVPDIPAAFGTSIKRVTNTVAWAAFGEEDPTTGDILNAQFAEEDGGLWTDTSMLNDGTEPPYDVEALDSNNAYFGTGSNPDASVIFTNDGGADFSSYDVSSFTPFVNSVHFFDPLNGILIGDPIANSFRWGIGVTTDGGQSWNPLAKPISAASGGIASWNNATAWVGNYGWFGTNSREILRTTNRGQNWVTVSTDTNQHSLSVAFDDDATHGFACFRSAVVSSGNAATGSNGIMVSSDSGVSWHQLTTLPALGVAPAAIQFIPNSNTAILTSNRGVYRTSDFGATWAPIGIPVSFSTDGAELSISRGQGEFIVSINSANSSGIATYLEAMPDDGVSESAPQALSLDVYPNPMQSSSIVAFTLPTSDHVQIFLYDALGREVATVLDGAFGAGFHQAPLNANGLAAGAYYLELETGTGVRAMRLVTIVQ